VAALEVPAIGMVALAVRAVAVQPMARTSVTAEPLLPARVMLAELGQQTIQPTVLAVVVVVRVQ